MASPLTPNPVDQVLCMELVSPMDYVLFISREKGGLVR
jgi:hypothetical protein